jgi:hypothetical protein
MALEIVIVRELASFDRTAPEKKRCGTLGRQGDLSGVSEQEYDVLTAEVIGPITDASECEIHTCQFLGPLLLRNCRRLCH